MYEIPYFYEYLNNIKNKYFGHAGFQLYLYTTEPY